MYDYDIMYTCKRDNTMKKTLNYFININIHTASHASDP